MSCLSPITVRHPRRRSSKWQDHVRDLFVNGAFYYYDHEKATTPETLEVPCGICSECRRARAAQWRYRLLSEHLYGNHKNALFVTLTIDEEHMDDCPEHLIPQYLRIFFERYRNEFCSPSTETRWFCGKPYTVTVRPKYPKFWFTTELGEKKGRMHLHGIIWDSEFFIPRECYTKEQLYKRTKRTPNERQKEIAHAMSFCWDFGFVFVGDECSARTMSYVTKYILKPCKYDYNFKPAVYCSNGIGRDIISVGSIRQTIRDAYVRHTCPFIPGSTRRIPAPRYLVHKCHTPTEIRIIADDRLRASQAGLLPFIRTVRGHKFTDEKKYREMLSRLAKDDIYLREHRKLPPRRRIDYLSNLRNINLNEILKQFYNGTIT